MCSRSDGVANSFAGGAVLPSSTVVFAATLLIVLNLTSSAALSGIYDDVRL